VCVFSLLVYFFLGKFVCFYIDNRAQIRALFYLHDCCNLMKPICDTNLSIVYISVKITSHYKTDY